MNKGAIFHGACGYFHVEINIVYIRIKLKDVGLCHGAAFFFSNNVSSRHKRTRLLPFKRRGRKQKKTEMVTSFHNYISSISQCVYVPLTLTKCIIRMLLSSDREKGKKKGAQIDQ
jgi:hypothetical protein